MWNKIVQHRLAFLVGVLVTAVVLAGLLQAEIRVVSMVCAILVGALWLGLAFAGIAALNARQPATFVVREGTFTTPPSVNAVLSAGLATVMPVAGVGLVADVSRIGHRPDWFVIGCGVLVLLLTPLQWYNVLGQFGMFLRPDGLLNRQLTGSVFVPWEAGPAAEPANFGVKLRFAHPDLLVRRGWAAATAIRTGADRGFTAWAINLYAARPDDRRAIGRPEELQRIRGY